MKKKQRFLTQKKSECNRMAAINTGDSKAPVKQVKRMQFGILGPDEIRRMSVTDNGGIRFAETYEVRSNL